MKKKIKPAKMLTFDDALNGAIWIVKREHGQKGEKPCTHCAKASEQLKALKKYFKLSALDDNSVYDAAIHKVRSLVVWPPTTKKEKAQFRAWAKRKKKQQSK